MELPFVLPNSSFHAYLAFKADTFPAFSPTCRSLPCTQHSSQWEMFNPRALSIHRAEFLLPFLEYHHANLSL